MHVKWFYRALSNPNIFTRPHNPGGGPNGVGLQNTASTSMGRKRTSANGLAGDLSHISEHHDKICENHQDLYPRSNKRVSVDHDKISDDLYPRSNNKQTICEELYPRSNNKQTICEDSHPGLGGLDDDESDTEDTDEAEVRDFQSTYPMQIIKSLIKKLWLTDSNFNTFKVCFCWAFISFFTLSFPFFHFAPS